MVHRQLPVARSGLWDSFRTLLQTWWRADRIRTSPTTGRILSLHIGDRFLLRNQIWTVMSRDVKCRDASAKVRLEIHCESEQQMAELICGATEVVSFRAEPAGLRINGRIIPIWDEDCSLLSSNAIKETAVR